MMRNLNLKRAVFRDRELGASHNSDPSVSNDYRISHAETNAGANYNKTYDAGYYAALWTKVEKPLLEAILQEMGGPNRRCLDFACGTGRITNVAADYFAEVVGVDVSETMLAFARVPDNVRLYRIDITQESLGETFDTITAFRFFLNAEEHLRIEALQVIREHLKDEGRLVCNIQTNATSPSGIASRMVNHLPWSKVRNTMSIDEMSTLLMSAGFAIERITAHGYLPRPGHYLPGLCEVLIAPAERIARAFRVPARFAQQFIVVARKR